MCVVGVSACGGGDSAADNVSLNAAGGDGDVGAAGSGGGSGGGTPDGSMGSSGGMTTGGAGSVADAGGAGGAAGASAADAGPDTTTPIVDAKAETSAEAEAGQVFDPKCTTMSTNATLTAHLKITADNECEVFVNGVSVGTTANWGVAVTIDVSLFVYPGRQNVIAVRGTNTSSQGGNDRGIIGQLTIDADGSAAALVVTDNAWRVSKVEEPNWTKVTFDDSAWIAATEIANNGDGPWGAVLSTSTAKWIWSAAVPAAVSDKPNLETTYTRREFYFSFAGDLSSQPACPAVQDDAGAGDQ